MARAGITLHFFIYKYIHTKNQPNSLHKAPWAHSLLRSKPETLSASLLGHVLGLADSWDRQLGMWQWARTAMRSVVAFCFGTKLIFIDVMMMWCDVWEIMLPSLASRTAVRGVQTDHTQPNLCDITSCSLHGTPTCIQFRFRQNSVWVISRQKLLRNTNPAYLWSKP